MESIKAALAKAQASRTGQKPTARRDGRADGPVTVVNPARTSLDAQHSIFSDKVLPQLDERQLEAARLVSFGMKDPSYIAFNILRTRIYKTMADGNWKSLAVTSPGPKCGKTLTSLNLAVSLARQEACKTVLVDLDLTRPTVAKTLGIRAHTQLSQYLKGEVDLEDCFVKVSQNLVMALNNQSLPNSSEIMLQQRTRDISSTILKVLDPDIVIFDLPPLLVGDDAIGFIPHVDCSMLVVAEGETTFKEIDESGRKLGNVDNFLGYVLNKSSDKSETAYYYEQS